VKTAPESELTPELFRRAAGQFATGVTIVSTVVDGQPHATTVNSFTSVSTEPPLILVCLGRKGRMSAGIARAGVFAVTVLSGSQEDLAIRFSRPQRPTGLNEFRDTGWFPAPNSGSPAHKDGVGYFDCVVHEMHSAGDHDIVIGRTSTFSVLSDSPQLIFSRSVLTRLTDAEDASRRMGERESQ
jgi:flavin reductase (DIM6/NTAB) family NADH-FMN oxidoreductase RutF